MSGLGEQIAVLDGLTIAPGDGNYGGGASYPDSGRWPLLPSSAGLNGPLGAQNDLMGAARQVYTRREGMPDLPNVAPGKRVFASASGSANMSGGSSYPDSGRFPLLSSTIGLSGLGARLNTANMTREQVMTAIQFHSQRMVNARQALAKLPAAAPQRRAVARAYYQSLSALCVLRAKAGLPALPECQALVNKIKARRLAMAGKGR